jgi:sulfur carrier protein
MDRFITVNGDKHPWREGMTVQDLLDEKRYTFRMLSVWINDKPVERDRFSSTPIPEGAKVQVVHMISGG